MSVQRIASRYAKSLLDLAIEQNKLERVKEDIEHFQAAKENRDLFLLLKSPIIKPGKKQEIFTALFADKYDEMTLGFLKIILTKGREYHLPEIADEFMKQYRADQDISTIKVTTASPLSESALKSIKDKLLTASATRGFVEIENAVDPDLIGGFVIEFGDNLYDASVAHSLEKLKKEFSKNLYVKDF